VEQPKVPGLSIEASPLNLMLKLRRTEMLELPTFILPKTDNNDKSFKQNSV
jgi:hypothetical protein